MAKKRAKRVMPKLENLVLGDGRFYGLPNRVRIETEIINFTDYNLTGVAQNGGIFRSYHESVKTRDQHYSSYKGKLLIQQRVTSDQPGSSLGIYEYLEKIPDTVDGPSDEDVMALLKLRQRQAHEAAAHSPPHMRRLLVHEAGGYRSYFYTYVIDQREFDQTGRIVLENLGLQFERVEVNGDSYHYNPSGFLEPHEDAKQNRSCSFYPDGGDDTQVSFYLQANLIDPEYRVGHVWVNSMGQQYRVNANTGDPKLTPGLYLSSYRLDDTGHYEEVAVDYLPLEKLTPENGFWRTERDASQHGANEHIRLEIEKLKHETLLKREELEAVKASNDALKAKYDSDKLEHERQKLIHEQELAQLKRESALEAEALRKRTAEAEAELNDQERQYRQRTLDLQIVLARIKEKAEADEHARRQAEAAQAEALRARERAHASEQLDQKERLERLKGTTSTMEHSVKFVTGLGALGMLLYKLYTTFKGPSVATVAASGLRFV